jgi:aspartate 1-decarboxylase
MAGQPDGIAPPRRSILKSKIHRAVVTHADVDYEGSLTLDALLLQAANILPFEEVHVWNVTRGTRLRTYAMIGEAGSGIVCVNGAAAHLAHPGDLVIVATFTQMEDAAAREHRPLVVLVDEHNRIRSARDVEIAGPQRVMKSC